MRGMHGRKRARLRVLAAVYIQAVARGRIARIEVAAKRSTADELEKTQQRSYLLDEEESARRAAAAELERERERAALAARMHELHDEPEGQRATAAAAAAAERPREQAEQASSGDDAADAEPQPPSSSGSSRRRKQKGKEAADHARGRLEAAAAGGKAKRQERSLIPEHTRHRVFETDATTHNQAFSLHRTAPPAAVRSDATGHLRLGFANVADRTHEHGGPAPPVADPCVGRWGLGRPREPARNRRAKLIRRGLDEARTRVFEQACTAAAGAHSARTRLQAASRPRPYAARVRHPVLNLGAEDEDMPVPVPSKLPAMRRQPQPPARPPPASSWDALKLPVQGSRSTLLPNATVNWLPRTPRGVARRRTARAGGERLPPVSVAPARQTARS